MDIYPIKAQYSANENVVIRIEPDGIVIDKAKLSVYRLSTKILEKEFMSVSKSFDVEVGNYKEEFAGYGVDFEFEKKGSRVVLHTAFDVVKNPLSSTRYGFLSDFTKKDLENEAVEWLRKCHINLVQYYDWSYRHDDLVSDKSEYTDMMGKHINRDTVCRKIEKTHEFGMRSIAYGAVYAAGKEFFDKHNDLALYTSCGDPFVFINTFYIMNISRNGSWRKHLVGQYRNAIEKMGFDGIHMDTYGFPKTAHNYMGEQVDLEEEFPALIDYVRDELEDQKLNPCLIFNNVGNWPVYATAGTKQDAIYVEVWEPYDRYYHLAEIIREAKIYSNNNKPIIVAAYIKPFRTDNMERGINAARLTMAAIVSCGAYHLLIGENKSVLTQGYYSDYTRLSDEGEQIIRSYYDFLVRYMELFYDRSLVDVTKTHILGDNYEYRCTSHDTGANGEPGKIWTILRENKSKKTISLINMSNCENDLWNEGKDTPKYINDIEFAISIEKGEIKGVYYSSPDEMSQTAISLDYRITKDERGYSLFITVPRVLFWSLVWVEL